ncbi:MAG: hypothetical protein A2087_05860 [Spirochaetes bacterium GWD1_61_31]|nr:MAG: hypothetical protein A2Y37_03810 [Spirochaetes bacterium GWB1_60_80]OHD42996.1 MAG: hypothetical protein A2087_05860 [Spirochaetes bacterium GWD1_61_31]OHD46591.1 MAG: hypothetical protein A2Y35_14800 [Spirochaetes bacterium GWE1_60_18]OHD61025.1 MAG: hypothetical protein A2Y32_05075 [Spirochaetes bacterium GWF1_60_12]HAP44772.1 hypothetical protein [Spirochaetaceae bacterium]
MGADELKAWRDWLIGDTGDRLLAAARRYLGPVKTPFNKHQLASSLEAWLRRPENGEAIIGTLYGHELRLLAILHYGGPLPPGLLAAGAADPDSHWAERQAQASLEQLQERLLIHVRLLPDGRQLVFCNPVLHEKIVAGLSSDHLFAQAKTFDPSAPALAGQRLSPWRRCLLLMSAVTHVRPFFRRAGLPGKKTETFLTHLGGAELAADRDELLFWLSALQQCGALHLVDETVVVPEPAAFLELARCFGAYTVLAVLAGSEPLAAFPASAVDTVRLLHRLLQIWPRHYGLSEADCQRLALVCLRRQLGNSPASGLPGHAQKGHHGTSAPVLPPDRLGELAALVVSALQRSGLLVYGLSGWQASVWLEDLLAECAKAVAAPAAPGDGADPLAAAAGSVVIENSHEVQLLPGAPAQAEAWVAMMCHPLRVELVWTGRLDKSAALAAFGFGYGLDDYVQRWQVLAGRNLPQSLGFSLASWYREFSAVRLRQGFVVVLDEHLSGLLDHAPAGETLVREKLAPGVYLLNVDSLLEAEKHLSSLGIHTDVRGQLHGGVGRPRGGLSRLSADDLCLARQIFGNPAVDGAANLAEAGGTADASLTGELAAGFPAFAAAPSDLARNDQAVQVRLDSLLAELAGRGYDAAVREVLAERIASRIIVNRQQLPAADGFSELVAGAMDYPGKLRLLERASQEKLPVDLSWTGPDGERLTCTGRVLALGKAGDGMALEYAPLGKSGERRAVAVRLLSKVRLLLGL